MTAQSGIHGDQTWLSPGEVLDERYRMESFLGRGGMCTVYRAEHLQLHRPVAIKVMNQAATNESAVMRFQREANAISQVHHPNVIHVFGFGIVSGLPYMALEFLEGEALSDRIQRDGPLTKEQFKKIGMQVCDGLTAAHEAGLVHRDLKPSNVMLVANDQVKLVDFGIVKFLPSYGTDIQKLTQTGEIFGTIAYMSPEQCMDEQLDGRSDIYSLGCMLYEMLTGNLPFYADVPLAVITKHLNATPPEDKRLGQYRNLIFQCLEKDKTRRPQNAAEVKALLESPKDAKVAGKKPVNVKALAVAATAVFAIISGAIYVNRPQPPPVDVAPTHPPGYIDQTLNGLYTKWTHQQLGPDCIPVLEDIRVDAENNPQYQARFDSLASLAYRNVDRAKSEEFMQKLFDSKRLDKDEEYFLALQIFNGVWNGDSEYLLQSEPTLLHEFDILSHQKDGAVKARIVSLYLGLIYHNKHDAAGVNRLKQYLSSADQNAIDNRFMDALDQVLEKKSVAYMASYGAMFYGFDTNPVKFQDVSLRAQKIIKKVQGDVRAQPQ